MFILFLSSCGGDSRYLAAYEPVAPILGPDEAYLLENVMKPRVIISEHIEDDLKIFTDQNYIVLGKSFFSGPIEDIDDAIDLGKDLKVTHVLLSSEYSYSGSKKAHKFISGHHYSLIGFENFRGYRRPLYDRMPDVASIPYKKEVPIFKQQAFYLVKLKD